MTTGERDLRRSVLAGLAVGAIAVAFVVLLAAAVVHTVRPPDAAGPTDVQPAPVPDRQEIQAIIGLGGQIEVAYRVRSARPVSALHVAADVTALRPDLLALQDVVVTTGDVSVARLPTVGPLGVDVSLSWPVRELEVTYRLGAPAGDDTESVQGRTLAFVPTLRLAYTGAVWPVRREVVAQGQDVLNVACLRPGDVVAQPCGSATDAGWTVDLATPDADDGLVVQVQRREPWPAHRAGGGQVAGRWRATAVNARPPLKPQRPARVLNSGYSARRFEDAERPSRTLRGMTTARRHGERPRWWYVAATPGPHA